MYDMFPYDEILDKLTKSRKNRFPCKFTHKISRHCACALSSLKNSCRSQLSPPEKSSALTNISSSRSKALQNTYCTPLALECSPPPLQRSQISQNRFQQTDWVRVASADERCVPAGGRHLGHLRGRACGSPGGGQNWRPGRHRRQPLRWVHAEIEHIEPQSTYVCRVQSCVLRSNVKPTFFQDRLLSFSYKRSQKKRIYSFFKQNSLSNQNVLFQISKFLGQKQSIFSVSKFFWDFKKFCSGFRNLWT